MNTITETITPARAKEMIVAHLNESNQRKLSRLTVSAYARAMRSGQWMLTHQRIAIDDDGELMDGNHRLHAIIESGVPVPMRITYGVPHFGNDDRTYTIDAIDRGLERSVGQQLSLRGNIANGNLIAAVTRGLFWLCCYSESALPGKFNVGNAHSILDVYGDEVNYCVKHRSKDYRVRNAATISASAFALKAFPDKVLEFYQKLTTGENLALKDPEIACRRWLMNSDHRAGQFTEYRAVLTCAMKRIQGKPLLKVYDSEHGYNFFLENQRGSVRRVLVSSGFIVKEQ